MAILSGINAKVTFTRGSGDTVTAVQTSDSEIVHFFVKREMKPQVTPLGSDDYQFVPDARIMGLQIAGFIDGTYDPGWFNDNALATVKYMPDSSSTGKYRTILGWVESIEMISAADAPNRYKAMIRASGAVTQGWS